MNTEIKYYPTIDLGDENLYSTMFIGYDDKHEAVDSVIAELRKLRSAGDTKASGYVQVAATTHDGFSGFEDDDASGYIDIYVGEDGQLLSECFDVTE